MFKARRKLRRFYSTGMDSLWRWSIIHFFTRETTLSLFHTRTYIWFIVVQKMAGRAKRALPRIDMLSTTIVQYSNCAYKYICISVEVQRDKDEKKKQNETIHIHMPCTYCQSAHVTNNKIKQLSAFWSHFVRHIAHWTVTRRRKCAHHRHICKCISSVTISSSTSSCSAFIRILLPHLSQSQRRSTVYCYSLICWLYCSHGDNDCIFGVAPFFFHPFIYSCAVCAPHEPQLQWNIYIKSYKMSSSRLNNHRLWAIFVRNHLITDKPRGVATFSLNFFHF